MLTSYPLLLGSLVAAFCATGIVSQEAYAQSTHLQSALNYSHNQGIVQAIGSSTQQGLPQAAAEQESHQQSVDVSYRGSGRLEEKPTDRNNTRNSAVAHRGSGRVLPALL